MPRYSIKRRKVVTRSNGRRYAESVYTTEVVELPCRPMPMKGVRVKRVS